MTTKRKKIIIEESPKPGEDISKWTNATPENYERIIWNSISNYNYRAQLDIVEILYANLEKLAERKLLSSPLANNIALRILQLFFEIADQFALVCLAILNRANQPIFETYIEGSNVKTRDFFNRCADKKISDSEIKELWGLKELEKADITDLKVREKIETIIKDTIKKERHNLESFGRSYANYDVGTKRVDYTSAVKGSFAIKHGYKQVSPSPIAKKLWPLSDTPTVMLEIKEVTRKDTGETKTLIGVGSLWDKKYGDNLKVSKILKRQIEFLSKEIKIISMIQDSRMDDPFSIIGLLHKGGLIKFRRNDQCPCGSGKKFKKCHGFG